MGLRESVQPVHGGVVVNIPLDLVEAVVDRLVVALFLVVGIMLDIESNDDERYQNDNQEDMDQVLEAGEEAVIDAVQLNNPSLSELNSGLLVSIVPHIPWLDPVRGL